MRGAAAAGLVAVGAPSVTSAAGAVRGGRRHASYRVLHRRARVPPNVRKSCHAEIGAPPPAGQDPRCRLRANDVFSFASRS